MTTTRRPLAAGALAAALALLAACADDLPTAPTQVTRGVTIYQHANYTGGSAWLTSDVRDLRDYTGPCEYEIPTYGPGGSSYTTASNWNDCISSIRVAPGWRATVYQDDDFKGHWLELTADAPNLQLAPGSCPHDGFNDCITSIRVRQQ